MTANVNPRTRMATTGDVHLALLALAVGLGDHHDALIADLQNDQTTKQMWQVIVDRLVKILKESE